MWQQWRAGIDHASFTATNDDTIGNTVHGHRFLATLDQRVHGIYHSNVGGHVWNNVVYRAPASGCTSTMRQCGDGGQ